MFTLSFHVVSALRTLRYRRQSAETHWDSSAFRRWCLRVPNPVLQRYRLLVPTV